MQSEGNFAGYLMRAVLDKFVSTKMITKEIISINVTTLQTIIPLLVLVDG